MQAAVSDSLDAFRALVLADQGLRGELHALYDPVAFIRLAVERAGAHGIALDAETLRQSLRRDPLGLDFAKPPAPAGLPPSGFLPYRFVQRNNRAEADWAYFGSQGLTDPFFESSVGRARSYPLDGLFRYQTSLEDMAQWAAQNPGLAPSGFIFHMSRCGSTLVSQMLASVPRNLVVSEAPPIDTAVRMATEGNDAPLKTVIAALGQKRSGQEQRYFVKLDSWHTLALPLFRRIFPQVPWIFLYRDPADVLMSQIRMRGIQTVPDYLPPAWFGIDPAEQLQPEEYCARVLGATCAAAIRHYSPGGGLLVNYRKLPDALWNTILPHFGVASGESERRTMAQRALLDAKSPISAFSAARDRSDKAATPAALAASQKWLSGIYANLEQLSSQT